MNTDTAIGRAIEALENNLEPLVNDEDRRRYLLAVEEWVVNVQANLPEPSHAD